MAARRHDRGVRRCGLQPRRVDDMANAGSLGCVERILVLHDAPLEIRRADEQEPLAARERRTERSGSGEARSGRMATPRAANECERFGSARRKNPRSADAAAPSTSSATRRPSCPGAPVMTSLIANGRSCLLERLLQTNGLKTPSPRDGDRDRTSWRKRVADYECDVNASRHRCRVAPAPDRPAHRHHLVDQAAQGARARHRLRRAPAELTPSLSGLT